MRVAYQLIRYGSDQIRTRVQPGMATLAVSNSATDLMDDLKDLGDQGFQLRGILDDPAGGGQLLILSATLDDG